VEWKVSGQLIIGASAPGRKPRDPEEKRMKTFAFRTIPVALATVFLGLGNPLWGQTAQSTECKARVAALSPDSVPTSGRPGESRGFYEAELRKAQPLAGGLTAQQASKAWQQVRDQRRNEEAAFKA
jgi:hypothetical protein